MYLHSWWCLLVWETRLFPPTLCRSSTPTCHVWAASTTGCPSLCPPWTCSALENRCSTKPKRSSTSSSSSTTSAAGEGLYLQEWFTLTQVSTRVNLSVCLVSWSLFSCGCMTSIVKRQEIALVSKGIWKFHLDSVSLGNCVSVFSRENGTVTLLSDHQAEIP